MNTNKRKKMIIVICLLTGVLLLIISILNYVRYFSVKIKTDLRDNEKALICEEFYINADSDIEYIYEQGSDRYGVRIKLKEYSAQYIDNILIIKADIQSLQKYLLNDDFYEYKASSGKYFSAKNISNYFDCYSNFNFSAYAYNENGKYYLEIEKSNTDNISIFQSGQKH